MKRKTKRPASGSAYGLRVIGCNWPLHVMYGQKEGAEHARNNSSYTPQQLELVKISWKPVKQTQP